MSAQNSLDVRVFNDPAEAPTFREPEFRAIEIKHANIVRNGTERGRSTVDLVLEDGKGQKYMMMITGRLVKMLSTMIGDEE